MDEKEAIEEAVRGRLSFLRFLRDADFGMVTMIDLMNMLTRPDAFTEFHAQVAKMMQRYYGDAVERAALFVLPAHECRTLNEANRTYPSSIVHPEDVIAPEGMVFFAEDLDDPYDGDERTRIRAISWSVVQQKDNVVPLLASSDEAYVLTMLVYMDGRRTPFATRTRLYPFSSVIWELGDPDGGRLWESEELNRLATRTRLPYLKILLAFFAIIRQRLVAATEPREIPAGAAKRIKHARKRHPNLSGKVQVVRFRQQTGSGIRRSSNGSGRKISVRTWVRPHWRWQWYGREGVNKPKLIMPYIRGPEGAPEVGRGRIFLPPKPLRERG